MMDQPLICGVPTFWLILTDWLERNGKRFSTLRYSLSSGSSTTTAVSSRRMANRSAICACGPRGRPVVI